jgi:phenylacetic acid degradation operon negative regulatory protein
MTDALDDLESRPGSTTALLRTVIGSTMRDHGARLPTAALVALMEAVGVPAGRTRTALTRLKAKGLVVAADGTRAAAYALTPAAVTMLARGDRRIYHPRAMADGDPWCLISFSVPEQCRAVRHQLRRRLSDIGCGTVASGLWIAPGYLTEEVEGIVEELGLGGHVTVFVSDQIRQRDLPGAAARWWDLDALRARHEEFLAAHAAELTAYRADEGPRAAFRAWIRVLDAWRPIPYLDPGLPAALLPENWPGLRSIQLFRESRDTLAAAAAAFARGVTGLGGGNGASPVQPQTAAGKGKTA